MSHSDGIRPEAVSILMKLARRDARLVPEDRAADGKPGSRAFMIVPGRLPRSKKPPRISAELVSSLYKNQLIARNHGGFVLSDTGIAFLRRKLAGSDSFRKQHQDRAIRTVEIEGVRKPAVIDESESPLGWLRRRKDKTGQPLIDAAQFEAGERLRRDFHYAGLSPRVTASWDGIPGDRASRRAGPGASTNLREQTVAAQQRVHLALEAVGPDLASVLIDVCCHLKGLEDTEKAKGWPRRSAKLVLQIALKELARHYGLIRSAADAARETSRRLMHWGSQDYKPQIQD